MTNRAFIICVLAFFILSCSDAQRDKLIAKIIEQQASNNDFDSLRYSEQYALAFYNLENLFDTERDLKIYDEEFTPNSFKKWDKDKYNKKLDNIGYVISQFADNQCPDGAALIGVAEVENKKVLSDLVNNKHIKDIGYRFVHYDSPDPRGIDVALLYNPKLFKLTYSKAYKYQNPKYKYYKTRDILLVGGKLGREDIHIIVNHWPSRKGENNVELRDFAAKLCKSIKDSISLSQPDAKIVIMGDLNDNPDDRSSRVILQSKKNIKDVKPKGLYNTTWQMYKDGLGTIRYQKNWNMFDQIMISESLLNSPRLRHSKTKVFNKDFLFQASGKYKGYPFRSFSGDQYINGFSDHFPIIMYLSDYK